MSRYQHYRVTSYGHDGALPQAALVSVSNGEQSRSMSDLLRVFTFDEFPDTKDYSVDYLKPQQFRKEVRAAREDALMHRVTDLVMQHMTFINQRS